MDTVGLLLAAIIVAATASDNAGGIDWVAAAEVSEDKYFAPR